MYLIKQQSPSPSPSRSSAQVLVLSKAGRALFWGEELAAARKQRRLQLYRGDQTRELITGALGKRIYPKITHGVTCPVSYSPAQRLKEPGKKEKEEKRAASCLKSGAPKLFEVPGARASRRSRFCAAPSFICQPLGNLTSLLLLFKKKKKK